MPETPNQVALITGGAHRIGATTARYLHSKGINVVIHYRRSTQAAEALVNELNQLRPQSAHCVGGDLLQIQDLPKIIEQSADHWGKLNILVNNASSFYPTSITAPKLDHWDDLMGTNVKAPYFLSCYAYPYLQAQQGSIVNMVDIHGTRPMKGYPIYSMAKASLVMLTKSLAREMGPDVRVNGVAPGAILWPEQDFDDGLQNDILDRTALKRQGEPLDIARAIYYLIEEANYTTGHILTVDGGRSLNH